MQKLIKIIAAVLCVCLCVGFNACKVEEKPQKNESGSLKIVCTLFPQYDFAREIAGDKAEITLLLTPGTDSHSYDPSPVDMVKINECNLFIYTGELMESWAKDVVSSLEENVTVLNVSEGLELSAVENGHNHGGEHSVDPHVWTDPVNAMAITRKICAVLCEIDPENASFYEANEETYFAKLDELNKNIDEIAASVQRKRIIMCDRFAMHYFCKRYGLEYVAAFDSCTADTEPSPAVIVKITNEVKENNIPAVFCAELSNRKVAEAVAQQTGVEVLELHSCHNLSADDFNSGETYLSLMEKNAENLKVALGVK
ncbi:MAG: zinc ABC transporter substrate-binding protein [Clostridia bacterium]|nr:zinc ABC transporter substrate-binding protein [Clostridia bacterium]